MKITLTGLDKKIDPFSLQKIMGTISPYNMKRIEFAILLSDNPEGRNRYPDLNITEDLAYTISLMGVSIAVHICGKSTLEKAFNKHYASILSRAKRIQLNGKISKDYLKEFSKCHCFQEIITQHVPYNEELLNLPIRNHSVLVDASGGRGISPKEWACPKSTVFWYPKTVGFAGGLGPHNLATELPKITSIAHPNKDSWVDMETSLRDENDWFDIKKAEEAISLVLDNC